VAEREPSEEKPELHPSAAFQPEKSMRTLVQSTMLITALVAFATVAAKQTSNLTPPPKRHYKYDGKVVKSFDKTLDQTVIALELMAIKDVEDPHSILDQSADHPHQYDRLQFSLGFTYPGKTLVTPKFIEVAVMYVALDPQKYEGHILSAKMDNERVELGRMSVRYRNLVEHRFSYKPYTSVALEMSISYEQLLRLANAKKVKMMLGKFEFDLDEDHLDAIRDLASRTVP
jgi:hypothetical protein